MACARQRVDLPDKRIVVENQRHLIARNHHLMRRDCLGQIHKMRIWYDTIGTISPDPRRNLQVLQFEITLYCQDEVPVFGEGARTAREMLRQALEKPD